MFRKRARAWVGQYEDPEGTPLLPIESLVDEGVLIAASGIRMTVKNLAILSILRDGGSYASDWYLDRVREHLAEFATEKTEDVARVERELAASRNPAEIGSSRSRSEEEAKRLIRRSEMLHGLIERLARLAADEAYVTGLALASRDAAWAEISSSIRASALRRASGPEPLSENQRASALRELRSAIEEMTAPPADH